LDPEQLTMSLRYPFVPLLYYTACSYVVRGLQEPLFFIFA
jgi:hypothetical protein